ncbi:MBL fold metallo-hydrolase [Notoacmeibacter sp. MSK16QG-6]|uniref:MBL fold metallo-hydrolase n=1 Tax=Notoacmeibacter sp. MSK16QG-6 TaxID=2957982 RepID=UPI00209D0713|nr:MBL fold metallo-hydrolase [Notoacmeibacter sp. MSK16QG-6]MCP1198199.1 MBL fold metallo-hydrolase [Notoacmeibacter sp. MSK16QG-6]
MDFDRDFEPRHGSSVRVADNVLRVTCANASPFTFQGTNSYVIGDRSLVVIDPGPMDEDHLETLVAAIDGRPVSHILVSHTHRDHSPLARPLQARVGGEIVAEGPHRAARALAVNEENRLDASGDYDFAPDREIGDGEMIETDEFSLTALHTPGHTANHLCFSMDDTGIVFSADHVMAWSTTIVAPPDGNMNDYMASLDRLIERADDRIYLPGHGGPVVKPSLFLRGLRTHRRMREGAILKRLVAGDRTISEMVGVIYRDIDPRLHGAAALNVFAHLEALNERGAVRCDEDAPRLDSHYFTA